MKSRGDEGQASVRVEWKARYGRSVKWQSEKLRRGVVLTPDGGGGCGGGPRGALLGCNGTDGASQNGSLCSTGSCSLMRARVYPTCLYGLDMMTAMEPNYEIECPDNTRRTPQAVHLLVTTRFLASINQ